MIVTHPRDVSRELTGRDRVFFLGEARDVALHGSIQVDPVTFVDQGEERRGHRFRHAPDPELRRRPNRDPLLDVRPPGARFLAISRLL